MYELEVVFEASHMETEEMQRLSDCLGLVSQGEEVETGYMYSVATKEAQRHLYYQYDAEEEAKQATWRIREEAEKQGIQLLSMIIVPVEEGDESETDGGATDE